MKRKFRLVKEKGMACHSLEELINGKWVDKGSIFLGRNHTEEYIRCRVEDSVKDLKEFEKLALSEDLVREYEI